MRPDRRPTWVTTANPGSRPANGRDTRFVTWALNRATAFGMVMRGQHREHARGRYGVDVPRRCEWVPENDPAYVAYHDREWGVPSRDDRHLFEMLTLEGAQAGLSWATILKKRDGYRGAFADFDAPAVARLDRRRLERRLPRPATAANRLQVGSAGHKRPSILAR